MESNEACKNWKKKFFVDNFLPPIYYGHLCRLYILIYNLSSLIMDNIEFRLNSSAKPKEILDNLALILERFERQQANAKSVSESISAMHRRRGPITQGSMLRGLDRNDYRTPAFAHYFELQGLQASGSLEEEDVRSFQTLAARFKTLIGKGFPREEKLASLDTLRSHLQKIVDGEEVIDIPGTLDFLFGINVHDLVEEVSAGGDEKAEEDTESRLGSAIFMYRSQIINKLARLAKALRGCQIIPENLNHIESFVSSLINLIRIYKEREGAESESENALTFGFEEALVPLFEEILGRVNHARILFSAGPKAMELISGVAAEG